MVNICFCNCRFWNLLQIVFFMINVMWLMKLTTKSKKLTISDKWVWYHLRALNMHFSCIWFIIYLWFLRFPFHLLFDISNDMFKVLNNRYIVMTQHFYSLKDHCEIWMESKEVKFQVEVINFSSFHKPKCWRLDVTVDRIIMLSGNKTKHCSRRRVIEGLTRLL